MKAIVAGFTPALSGWTSEKAVALLPIGSSRAKTDSDRPKANLPRHSDGDHGTAPFWTWFIENPRRAR
jgi:hypothetical protein